MSDEAQANIQTRIRTALRATRAADKAGDAVAADIWWRECVGLMEMSMGRTGSAAHLTLEPKREERLPK